MESPDNESALLAQIHEIENSLFHLERSNKEMEEYLKEEDDRELRHAIEENRDLLYRKHLQLEELKNKLPKQGDTLEDGVYL